MQILFDNVLDVHSLDAISSVLADTSLFSDGKTSASGLAANVKFNLQANPDKPEIIGAAKLIETSLENNLLFKAAAIPHSFVKTIFSRYTCGMHYGTHIDEPFINNKRTDLSFTLFLSDPDTYQGGELVLQKHDGEEHIKLPKGSLYLYPSTSLHRVNEVTVGERHAAVGWIQSRVKLAEHREILFDLQQALFKLAEDNSNDALRLTLLKTKNSIMRLWSE